MSAGPPESAQPTLADRVDSHFEFCALHGKDLVDYGKRKRVGDGNIAEAALAAGDNVVAGARRTEELAPLVAQYGERVKPVTLEVRDEAAATSAVRLDRELRR